MSLKKQAVSGVKWNFLQQFSVQIINFGVQVILARLLMPEMFGLIAMIIVFISIGKTLMDSGMTSSLIRTKNPDQIDYSTVFVTNLLMSIAIYGVTYSLAPLIAEFYNQEVLIDIVRVFALTFVIRAFVAVHVAKLTKEMNFKLQMKLQIPSTIIAGIVGVTLAYQGYGVWSLVWLNLVQAITFTIQNWLFINWRPSLIFDRERFKHHFVFGYKLTIAGLIDTIYNDAYRITIGKFFSPASVGFFHQAETMRLFPVQQISAVMGKVTYPFFANIDGDKQLKAAYKITMKLVLFVVIPIMLTLIVIAEEGFLFVFGEKWLPAVPYFQILAIASILRPISSYNLNILKVKGRSDLSLKVEIIKKAIGLLAIAIGIQFDVMGLVISLTVVSFIWVFINMSYCGNLISYPVFEQLKDVSHLFIIGSIVFTLSCFFRVYLTSFIEAELLIILAVGLFFTTTYLALIYITDRKLLLTIKSAIKND